MRRVSARVRLQAHLHCLAVSTAELKLLMLRVAAYACMVCTALPITPGTERVTA